MVTNIDIYNIRQSPYISITLKNDIYYDYIQYKMDKKWFYSINSDSIFNNGNNELSRYSYDQLNELNINKIQNSLKVFTNQFFEVIKNRLEIKNYMNNIISTFDNLKNEKNKITNLDSNITIYNDKIKDIDEQITMKKNLLDEIDNIHIQGYNNELSELEKEHNKILEDLDNECETIKIRQLESSYYKHTICDYCKQNCHYYCDCLGLFGRCKVFPIFQDYCDECFHSKSSHDIRVKYYYVDKEIKKKIPNDEKKEEENERYNNKKDEINLKLDEQKTLKEKIYEEIESLNERRNNLENGKNCYVNEKDRINNGMKKLNKEMYEMISNLIDVNNKIEATALNKFQFEIENDYIDNLIDEIYQKDNNKIKIKNLIKLKQTNINNRIHISLNNLETVKKNYFE